MTRNFVPHIIFIATFSLISNFAHTFEANWKPVKEGNKIILIRHALAPGGGDPIGFKIDDCKTQRNLNGVGVEQSKNIGKLFKDNKIIIDQVLSSQWCRCKDTAKYAFGNYKEFKALNSTFQSSYSKNEAKQLKEIYSLVKKWDGKGKNLILVTHYSIITAVTNAVPNSGEIVITDKNFEVIGTVVTD